MNKASPDPRRSDPPGPISDRRLIFGGLRWSTVGYPLSVGLAFASQVLAANLLLPAEYGTFALAISVMTLGALLAQVGLPQSLLRRASAALAREDFEEARHEIVSALVIGFAAASLSVLVLGSPLGEEGLDAAFSRTTIASVALLVGARTGLRVLENLVPEVFRAFRDYMRATIFDGILANLLMTGTFVVLLVTSGDASVSDLLLISVVASVLALVPAGVGIARKLRTLGRTTVRLRNPVEPGMWFATMGRALIAQLDLLVVGALGTAREIALYSAPFRLALLVGLPLVAVNQVVTPLIAGWFARGETRRLERTMRGTAGLSLVAAGGLGLVYFVLGRQILETLFGTTYGDAFPVLAILVTGQILQTWSGSCGFAMMMTGHHRLYAIVLGISSVLTAVLDVALYEVMGIEGVALATASMLVAQNVANMLLMRKLAGIRTTADLRLIMTEVRELRDARRGSPTTT